MYCIRLGAVDLIIGQDTPSRNSTLLVSHCPSLWKTVIRASFPAASIGCLNGRVVALEIRVAVEHEERRAQERQRLLIAPAVPCSSGPSNE